VADSEAFGRSVDAGRPLLGEVGQALLDVMPMPAYLCDPQGLVVACNAAAGEWWGSALRAGMRGEAFLHSALPWPHAGDGVPVLDTPLARVRRTGKAMRNVEVVIETAAGDHLWALADVVPLPDRHGAVRALLCSFRVTQPQDDVEDLFENGAIGLHFVAPDGTILRANRAELELLGYRRDEYVGHNLGEFHADQDVLADILARLHAGEAIDKCPARLIARGGQIRHVEISSSGCFRDGKFVHSRCFTVDVTARKQLADAACEQERLARQLLQALPAAIYTTDGQGKVTFYNEAAAVFAGQRPVLGEEWCASWKLFRADGTPLPHDQCPMVVAIREARPIHGEEVAGERPDGSRIAFVAYPTPLFDAAGAMVGTVNMLVDITDRKNIERPLQGLSDTLEQRALEHTDLAESASLDLHYSERNFALLVGSIVDYAIYMLDPDGVITNWNPGAARIKGYRAEEVVGRNFSCFYTPEDCAKGLPAKALAIARREGRYSSEGWRVRKDGSRFWASVVIDPVLDRGKLVGFAKITRDVTERMEAEAALKESEYLARGVIDTALDGFAQLDEHGRVVQWNPRAENMFGWSREEAMGRSFLELVVAEEDRLRFTGAWSPTERDVSRKGDQPIGMVDRNGRKIPVEVSISSLPVGDSHRVNVFIHDLSEKIHIEAQLRQAQKMEAVGQLTGGIAHDFNNLLQGIIGSLDLIQARVDAGSTADMGRFVTAALASANRAAAMIHRLLAFSRRQPLDPQPVLANPLVVSMADLMQRTMGEQIKLEFELAMDLWPTLCDPNQLESSLLNLSINARDAMPAGGHLIIRSYNAELDEVKTGNWCEVSPGDYVCIEVADTGVGMTAEVVDRAFEPFFTTKAPGQGTGLGLSMVYGFARQSNGYCEIQSEPGVGTTVNLYLPRHIGATDERSARATTLASANLLGERQVVLVVEDESAVRHVVVEVLHQLGCTTLEAASAEEALVTLQTNEAIHLLISDIGLSGMDGRLLAEMARETRPDLDVLLMTGYAPSTSVVGGFAAGMQLITKPFTVDALVKRLFEMTGKATALPHGRHDARD